MASLYGKGIWLLNSADVDLAVEMGAETGATHILCKTGHGGMFFPGAARRMQAKVRAAGLSPFAWTVITADNIKSEARVILKTAGEGYEGIIVAVDDRLAGKGERIKELGWQLFDAGLDPQTLFYASFPDISQHSEIPHLELNAFFRGGFMPQSYAAFRKPAEVVIHKLTYEEYARASRHWEYAVGLFPIVAGFQDEAGGDPLSPQAFAHWLEVLTSHQPTFFSVFHAAATDRALWPALAGAAATLPKRETVAPVAVEPPPVEAPPPMPARPVEPELDAVYITIQPDDTIARLCQKYGCSRESFWNWNGYLWDDRWLPRDPDYMQTGWRVRVK